MTWLPPAGEVNWKGHSLSERLRQGYERHRPTAGEWLGCWACRCFYKIQPRRV